MAKVGVLRDICLTSFRHRRAVKILLSQTIAAGTRGEGKGAGMKISTSCKEGEISCKKRRYEQNGWERGTPPAGLGSEREDVKKARKDGDGEKEAQTTSKQHLVLFDRYVKEGVIKTLSNGPYDLGVGRGGGGVLTINYAREGGKRTRTEGQRGGAERKRR